MNIAFSSLVCPTWDLHTMADKAVEYGYEGIELRGLGGELELTRAPELASRPEMVRAYLNERNLKLVALGSSVTLDNRSRRAVEGAKARLVELMELAQRLGCPMVRIFAGETGKLDTRQQALARIAEHLRSLMPAAVRTGVTIAVENGVDFVSANHMWYLMDAVGHPNLRVCWNQCHAMSLMERATFSLPRLGTRIGLLHVTDADFDPEGILLQYRSLGQGQAEIERQIWILRGLVYRGWLVFEWPRLWIENLPSPEAALPEAAKFLRACVQAEQDVLSAYKGDKNAARFAAAAQV